jgi:hypothetical protein
MFLYLQNASGLQFRRRTYREFQAILAASPDRCCGKKIQDFPEIVRAIGAGPGEVGRLRGF